MLFERLEVMRDDVPRSAPLNMAIDEVLLGVVQDPLLRIYRWERPAVSFGYFGRFASVAAAWPGREIVRRMTGGGVVAHGSDLTYSLIVPSSHPFAALDPKTVYREVHEALRGLLVNAGEGALLAGVPSGAGNGACFESPEEFDLLARGKKVAGAAMRRTRHGLLLQGSIQELPHLDELRPRVASSFAANVAFKSLAADELASAQSLAALKYATPAWTMRL